jgi:hypothetical protein
VGRPSRFGSAQCKTQEDLDREREAKEALIPKVTVEIKGSPNWTQEEAFQYLEEKAKAKPKETPPKRTNRVTEERKQEAVHRENRAKRKERTIDEIYYAAMAKAGWELPKPKPTELPKPAPYDAEADWRMNEGLRARLLTGRKPQDPVYPPLPREMTAEEEARYWWGKAREGMSR